MLVEAVVVGVGVVDGIVVHVSVVVEAVVVGVGWLMTLLSMFQW